MKTILCIQSKQFTFFTVCLLATLSAKTQTRVQVKRDTVIVNNGELKINNSSKNVLGYLYNTGNGTTQFKPLDKSLDTLWGVNDTLYYKKGSYQDYTLLSGKPAIGNAVTGATKGSIFYAGTNGSLQQSNAALYFDSANQRLGVGIAAPVAKIHALSTAEQLRLGYDATNYTSFTASSTGLIIDNVAASGTPVTQFSDVVYATGGIRTNTTFSTSNFGTGGVNILTTADANWLFGGAGNVAFRVGGRGASAPAIAANYSYAGWLLAKTPVLTASSGTHAVVANLGVLPPSISSGGSAITNAATVYIDDAPAAGVSNWALLINNGASKFGGDIKLANAGNGIFIKEGTNALMGQATLVNGRVTVNTTKVAANSRIFLTINGGGLANVGTTYISSRTAGSSFTITSTNAMDASNVAWLIVQPN